MDKFQKKINFKHDKESYPFQPMCLRLLTKSMIFVTTDATIFHGI
jgi:hypothetical protein